MSVSTPDDLVAVKDALTDMLAGWKYIRSFHGDLYGVGWDRAQGKAEKALELLASLTAHAGEPTDEQIRRLFVEHGHIYAGWLELGRAILALSPSPIGAGEPTTEQALLDVGRQMVEITTTVRGIEEWPAIPGLWLECMHERDEALAKLALSPPPLVAPVGDAWQSIDTAPQGREMFVVKAFNVSNGFTGGRPYTSDPWCVWQDEPGKFARWPHNFAPTHWHSLAAAPKSPGGQE